METPDEIKKMLKKCPNADCSLCMSSFHCDIEAEALEYIQQLEYHIGELTEKVAQLEAAQSAAETFKRERDALLVDLKEAAKMDCSTCKDYAPEDGWCEESNFVCRDCIRKDCPCRTCEFASNWQWRGVKTDDEAGD